MNLGQLQTARRNWHITYTLLTSTRKVFVVKVLALLTVEQILRESWWSNLKWTNLHKERWWKCPEEKSPAIGSFLPGWPDLRSQIWPWDYMVGKDGLHWSQQWHQGWRLSWPTHCTCSSCTNRDKSFILGFTDKLELGLSIGFIRKELRESC